MIKMLLIAIVLLVVVACGEQSEIPVQQQSSEITATNHDGPNMGRGVTRFVDHKYQVVCWWPHGGTGIGIACLSLNQLEVIE